MSDSKVTIRTEIEIRSNHKQKEDHIEFMLIIKVPLKIEECLNLNILERNEHIHLTTGTMHFFLRRQFLFIP